MTRDMRAKPECLPCCLKQMINIAERVTSDEEVHERLIRRGLEFLSRAGLGQTPAEISTGIFRLVTEALNVPDPFGLEKSRYNAEAMAMYPRMRGMIAAAGDPFRTALLLSVAGNLIDLGILAPMAVDAAVESVLSEGFAKETQEALQADLAKSRRLLIIGDNAGEIAFDRLLAEEIHRLYPRPEIVFAVKSGPAMNDATARDAAEVKLNEIAEVIETGGAYLGVPKIGTTPAFWEEFNRADVVIAKGHANYETLDDVPHPALYSLVTVKCGIVAAATGVKTGDSVLVKLSFPP